MTGTQFMAKLNARRGSQGGEGDPQDGILDDASATMTSTTEQQRDEDAIVLPLDQIQPDPEQARKSFHDIDELADNIAAIGQQHAIVVKALSDGHFQIVDGERRYRAITRLNERQPGTYRHIRAWVNRHVSIDDAIDRKIVQLCANEQRHDVPPLELAREYQAILQAKGWKQRDLAAAIGKSEGTISKTLKLLLLSDVDQQRLSEGSLSARQVKEGAKRKVGNAVSSPARTTRVPVSMPVARTLIELVDTLSRQYGLADITIPEKPTKKELEAILESRAADVLMAVREHA